MIGKITEFPNNVYLLGADDKLESSFFALNHNEHKKFAKIMLINTLIAYDRSHL